MPELSNRRSTRSTRRTRRARPALNHSWPGSALFLDEIPATMALAGAPPQVSACANARLGLFKTFLRRANAALTKHDARRVVARLANGTATDSDTAATERYGRATNTEHERLIDEAQQRGYGIGYRPGHPEGPQYALCCGHTECGDHEVESIAIASPVPSVQPEEVTVS